MRILKVVFKVMGGMLMVLFLVKLFMININFLLVIVGVFFFYVVFVVIFLVRNLKNMLFVYFCWKKDKVRIVFEKFFEVSLFIFFMYIILMRSLKLRVVGFDVDL